MTKCVKVQRTNKTVCVGALRDTIQIMSRAISGIKTASASHLINFSCFAETRALVETKQGVETFDSTNINGLETHHFTIRYLAGIDSTMFVQFNCKNFSISRIINLNEENRYLTLICSERGDPSKKVNESGFR